MINIRKAEIKDLEKIILLLNDIGKIHHEGRPDIFKEHICKYDYKELKRLLIKRSVIIFVAADEDDNCLGYAINIIKVKKNHKLFTDRKTLYIDDLCVDNNYRNQGVGKMLMDKCKMHAKEIKAANILLNVWNFKKSALEFYEKAGFSVQSQMLEYKIHKE